MVILKDVMGWKQPTSHLALLLGQELNVLLPWEERGLGQPHHCWYLPPPCAHGKGCRALPPRLAFSVQLLLPIAGHLGLLPPA